MSLKLKAGEYLILEKKKYQIIELYISADTRDSINDKQIETIADRIKVSSRFKDKKVELDIPLIF